MASSSSETLRGSVAGNTAAAGAPAALGHRIAERPSRAGAAGVGPGPLAAVTPPPLGPAVVALTAPLGDAAIEEHGDGLDAGELLLEAGEQVGRVAGYDEQD
jgi:hypothetical protein